jgi:murein DD-endopeptidase MepM/ murein hydrolase activator NlpD
MLRFGLVLALVAIAAGVGFFYGRHLHPVGAEDPIPASGPEQSRSRTANLALTPPAVAPSADSTKKSPFSPRSSSPLGDRDIGLPIAGLTAADIHDTFAQSRSNGERRHEASDIMAPRGTPVIAVEDGVIKKLFTSKPGGLTIYQFDPQERYCYYYAHLDRYAHGIREGLSVTRGEVIGYVGSTGNANPDAPHLHFAILELGPDKKWWDDTTPINPYPILMEALRWQMSGR